MFSLLFVHLTILTITRFGSKTFFKPKEPGAKKVPCLGGIGIYAAFLTALFATLLFKDIRGPKILGLLLSSGLILILDFIDDINDLNPFPKIIGELLGAGVLISFGFITKIVFLPVWANMILTVLWVLIITNAFNLLDIMDGLASGLLIIISSTLLYISFINQDTFSIIILIALIGANLGFLKYNYPPAKVYMGDTGSLFSGFLLAALTINISYAPLDRPVALITPLLVVSLPIYDTLFLIIIRVKKRKPIFKKTNDHFALRLITMGYSVRKSIWMMYLFSIFLAISSLIVAFGSNVTGIVMIIAVILLFILMWKRVGIIKV
jgi:UDP-GlcNAc:undecaprenyl-phosphate GlcNAc-1-phosphate transferase